MKIIRIALISLASFAGLVILIFLFINLPFSRNFVSGRVNALFQKLELPLDIQAIKAVRPKKVHVEGFSIIDPRGDTIIYARNVKTEIKLLALIKSKVILDNAELSGVGVELLMNYQTRNYTISEAFKKGKKNKAPDPEKKGAKWEIKIRKGEIQSVHFFMEDTLSGIRIEQDVENLKLKRFGLDLRKRELGAHSIDLKRAMGAVRVLPRQEEKKKQKNKARGPMKFGLDNLSMEELDFAFEHTGDSLLLEVWMDKGQFETRKIDIPAKVIDLEKIAIEGSTNKLYTAGKTSSQAVPNKNKSTGFPWEIKTRKIDLEAVDMVTGQYAHGFADSLPSGMAMENLQMKLRDLQISQAAVGLKLSSLGFQLSNGFTLDHMEAKLKSDEESTSFKMELETVQSRLDLAGDVHLGFFNLIKDPSGATDANLRINNTLLHLYDVSFFMPALEEVSVYPVLASTPTRVDVQMELEERKLILSDFSLSQVNHFTLALNGFAASPFEPSKASGEMDLILSGINTPWLKDLLPDSGIDSLLSDTTVLSLMASISDTFRAPKVLVQLASNLGQVDLNGSVDLENERYKFESKLGEVQLGDILKVSTLGAFNGSLELEGSGFSAESINSKLNLHIDSVTFNDYSYTRTHVEGELKPGLYDFYLQSQDTAFNSVLTLNLRKTDSLFSARASGSLFAQLDHLHLLRDTLALRTDMEASLIKKPNLIETGVSLQDIALESPDKSTTIQNIEALFRIDSSRTSLTGEGDFFNLRVQVEKNIHELDGFATDYSNYLRTFVDTSLTSSDQRVTQLPGIYAYSHISNHDALDILLQDTGIHISNLDFTILNEPVNQRVKYIVDGSELHYKMIRLGNLDLDLVDSAGILDLQVVADSSSIFSGPPGTYQLSSQFADWKGLTELFILNQQKDTLYNVEVESLIDENQMILNIPSEHLVLNHQNWDLDSSAFLSIDLDSFRVSPDFTMRTDSSFLQFTHRDLEEGIDYQLNANRVKLSSLIWDDLLSSKPDGYLSGSVDITLDNPHEKKIVTNLNVVDISISGLEFNKLLVDGFLTISDSGNYSTKLFAQLDSSTVELEGENILNENRYLKADYSHIPLEIVESFTEEYLSEMAGYISGSFKESTLSKSDKFTGDLSFRGAKLKIVPLNTPFTIPDQRIQFEDDKIILNKFRIQDTLNKALEVDGFIDFRDKPITTDLNISSSKLQLMNTTEKDNENFYGSLFVDSDISFKGAMNNPNIDAKISLSRGTELTINSKDDVDLSESAELVNFTSHAELGEPVQLPSMAGPSKFHMASIETIIEIDPATRVNFNLAKKIFYINLAIQGGGLINYSMLNNNQVSLAGRYEISEGSAELNIVGWPNKFFKISKGGYVNWDGKVEDPELKFEAISKVSSSYTNPVDGRMRNVDFNVVLMLSQQLSDLNILFTINTEDQYLMSIINTLSPEEQMRQAITILLFEIIDLPGISTSSDYMSQQVSQILASQLNQITKSAIKGVDISFGIDTYTQSVQGGGENTSTSLSYEVKKSLLNDRAQIQVSGRLQNPNDVPGSTDQTLNNLSFEYQLDSAQTKYLKVYNEQTYEDVFEGQVIKTGVGFTYRKPYRTFREIWKRKKKQQKDHEE